MDTNDAMSYVLAGYVYATIFIVMASTFYNLKPRAFLAFVCGISACGLSAGYASFMHIVFELPGSSVLGILWCIPTLGYMLVVMLGSLYLTDLFERRLKPLLATIRL